MRGLALALILAGPAAAEDVVGTGIVGGRAVELLSDGTWRALAPTAEGCQPIVGSIAFCSGPPEFIPVDDLELGSPIDAQWRAGDARFTQIIHGATGAEDGMTERGLRAAVIENAARSARVDPAEITVIAEVPALVDGVLGTTLVLAVPIDGTSYVFQNTLVLAPRDHAQIMTFGVGTAPSGEMAALHQRFLDAVRIDPDLE